MDYTTKNDGELLRLFCESRSVRGEEAFQEIFTRHGAMVLNTCQRILHSTEDASDATQAVFMVLASKASSLTGSPSVGGWLYSVARNAARDAARKELALKKHEKLASETVSKAASDEREWETIRGCLDEELYALPKTYREPIILFHLEGRSLQEAATSLGCNAAAVGQRLSRGREMLKDRLARRGKVFSVGALFLLISNKALAAELPLELSLSATKAAKLIAAGQAAAVEVSSSHALAIAKGVMKKMLIQKIGWAASIVLGIAAMGSGTGFYYSRLTAAEPKPPAAVSATLVKTADANEMSTKVFDVKHLIEVGVPKEQAEMKMCAAAEMCFDVNTKATIACVDGKLTVFHTKKVQNKIEKFLTSFKDANEVHDWVNEWSQLMMKNDTTGKIAVIQKKIPDYKE